MRKARTKEEIYEMQDLLYLGAYVLACGLGYFLGKYFFGESRIDLLLLILLYVVLFFAIGFVAIGLDFVFNLLRLRVNGFLHLFLSLLVLFACFLFLYFWLSGWNSKKLFNLGTYVLIYFILPLGVSLFAMNMIGKALGYSFILDDEQEAMV